MKFDFKDKTALITGSAQGIGREIALMFAENNSNVCVCDVNIEAALKTAEELKAKGIKSGAYKLDVSDYKQVEDTVKKILDNFGKIDILVNNAGITRDNLLVRMNEKEWDMVIDINLKGTFNCTKAVSKPMMKKRYGRIINIASIIGLRGNPGQANYSAAKGGIIALTKTCAKELGSRNITVNAVAPGFIQTQMTDVLSEDVKNNLMQSIPLRRLGLTRDVASACIFLSSDYADYITGQVLQVDGGIII